MLKVSDDNGRNNDTYDMKDFNVQRCDFPVKKCPDCDNIYEQFYQNQPMMIIYRHFPLSCKLEKEKCPDCQGKDVKIVRGHTNN